MREKRGSNASVPSRSGWVCAFALLVWHAAAMSAPADTVPDATTPTLVPQGSYQGLTATASSCFDPGRTPDRAFDGDLTTYWVPKRSPCWVQLDLGDVRRIDSITWSGDRSGTYASRIPETYRFTGSCTGSFTGEQFLLAGAEGNRRNARVIHRFSPVSVRYVRMEIYASYPEPHWQPSIDEIVIGAKQQIELTCTSPWTLFSVIEELRTLGYPIPPRLDQIQTDVCRNLNFETFFSSGAFAERLAEARSLIAGLDWQQGTPRRYESARTAQARIKASAYNIPVWTTDTYFTDTVLGVGLKSYPYLADMTGDGRDDLLVGDHDGVIYVYANQGSPQQPRYGAPTRLKSASTGLDIAVKLNPKLNLADMNGDGKPDLVLGGYDGEPYMLPNEATDNGYVFDDHKLTRFNTKAGVLDVGNYAYPLVTDWNLDGLPDLLVGELGGNVLLFRHRGTAKKPLFKDSEVIASIAPDMYPDPQFADLTGDGRRDLVLGGREGKVALFRNIGTDRFPRFADREYLSAAGTVIDVGRLSHVFVGDWNADTVPDLLVGNDDGEVRVFRGEKRVPVPAFAAPLLLRTTVPGELIAKTHPVVCFADWNGDGLTDLLAGGEGGEVRFYPNGGTPQAPAFDTYQLLPGVDMSATAFADAAPEEREHWQNSGLEFISEYLGNCSPEVTDWDGDGRLDLLVGNYAGLIYFFRNTGTPTAPKLAPPQALSAGERLLRIAGYSTPRAVDWNRDGLPDLITGDLLGRVHLYLNTGDRAHPHLDHGRRIRVRDQEAAFGPRTMVEATDVNGDGMHDVLIGNRFGRVYALINRGTDAAPRFEDFEPLRDRSAIWEKLYAGCWAGPFPHSPLNSKHASEVTELSVEATACPRMADLDGDGTEELMISHRFGRVFVFRPRK